MKGCQATLFALTKGQALSKGMWSMQNAQSHCLHMLMVILSPSAVILFPEALPQVGTAKMVLKDLAVPALDIAYFSPVRTRCERGMFRFAQSIYRMIDR